MPLITVIIATSGRPSLEKTLAALDGQTIPKKDFVVHIIENSVQPSLKPLIEKFKSKMQLVYDVQRIPGKSAALNHGIQSSTSELIAFTDDDCIPAQNWLQMILQTFGKYPDTACVSGTFSLVSSQAHLYPSLRGLMYRHPFTARGFKLRPWEIARGGNFAVRRSIFATIGTFDCDFGPGSFINSGDEADWLLRVLESGSAIVHEPSIAVVHHPPWNITSEALERTHKYYIGTGAVVAKHLLNGNVLGALSLINPITYVQRTHTGATSSLREKLQTMVLSIPFVLRGAARYFTTYIRAPRSDQHSTRPITHRVLSFTSHTAAPEPPHYKTHQSSPQLSRVSSRVFVNK